ncbi:hypothetical protein [Streptomyces sp. NPDC048606]|uniref:hypothetical protein n=1 Tax=Streptomyces sp. NPDC048606 TaxID=3154726 RepID=UPI003414D27F
MRTGSRRGRTGGRWLGALLVASAAFTSGCAAFVVDPAQLPGVYRNEKTGGEVRLGSDGTFSATDVTPYRNSGPTDFSGNWEYMESTTMSDFVYLNIEDDGLGRIGGIQLYVPWRGEVEFRDPDEPPAMVLKKVPAP